MRVLIPLLAVCCRSVRAFGHDVDEVKCCVGKGSRHTNGCESESKAFTHVCCDGVVGDFVGGAASGAPTNLQTTLEVWRNHHCNGEGRP